MTDKVDVLVDDDVSLKFNVSSVLPPEIWVEQNGVMLSPELVRILRKYHISLLFS